MVMEKPNDDSIVTLVCANLRNELGLQWLIGSPFLPPSTIVSVLRSIHTLENSSSLDYHKESEDIRTLLLKGFDVIGALIVEGSDLEETARKAIDAVRQLRKCLAGGGSSGGQQVIGAVADSNTGDIHYFVSRNEDSTNIEAVTSVVHEGQPEKYIWEIGCLLRCELPIKLPVYIPANNSSDAERMYLRATEAVIAKLKDPQTTYVMERSCTTSSEIPNAVVVRGTELDFDAGLSSVKLVSEEADKVSDGKTLTCGHFFSDIISASGVIPAENAGIIQVNILLNRSDKLQKPKAPAAEYFPNLEETRLLVMDFELDVICYAARDLLLIDAVSRLIIPGLIDQFNSMKNALLPKLLTEYPQLHAYHFNPPGILHPVTVIYELNYGETELKQVEARRSLHLRLGLPFNRPLLRIANALNFNLVKDSVESKSRHKGPRMLKDVHFGIPSSGVSGGIISLVQGSYEYYHYLQDGFDDSGWGCAYRSLQTIISWFRLQHYTSTDVPSHRDIQQALVDIGDKDPSFIGSREWIGAIELSFVLDKLLGVSCKIINVMSGAELPEKCRELALHFENQGTPVMIGGGVLAYTLLGVDYNEGTGDCAFLILDPHYTGNDEHKKIVNGGWCGWKKAVDNKGKNFFLHDKFYNLLLPQRPNMV
ncbi:hypothetical protein K2173_001073 [Erythroxylum novogranatense]|uniref:Probable Ufm1-specific protease n=1 Tax=Erythroxylum novogranatense TaxID=1862640 RepID=A0AAV8SIF3_9ROSI|nr:hypothetical protein K2173_001073 [Erythroxylum novogranatense]